MTHFLDCDPRDLARLSRTEPAVLEHIARLVRDGLDPVLHVARGPHGTYELTITGLDGDRVVSQDTVIIRPADDATHALILIMIIDQALAKTALWALGMNKKLLARGLPPIVLPASSS